MGTSRRSRLVAAVLNPDFALVGAAWLSLAVGLSALTYRIADWWKVPDEMVFQRLGMSIGRTYSLVPQIHGEFIRSLNQLYPLLISPIVSGGYVSDDLPQIRVLNAVVVTSAFIPAFLLARRVTNRRWAAYLVGALSVCIPWLVLAAFMLTEVVALPAFLWAMLAFQRSLVLPSLRADILALGSIMLAVSARTQFVVLAGVLPVAILANAVPRGPGLTLRSRFTGTARRAFGEHKGLASVYAVGALAAVLFELAGGKLLSLSIYGEQFGRGLTPHGVLGWALGHAADLAFTLGILPFLVGGAWLLANLVRPAATRDQQAFACLGTTTVVVLIYAVTTFDLQLGGFIFDRYLAYIVPLIVLAFVCALLDERRPRWSLAVPTAVVAGGFLLHMQQPFTWRDAQPNSDSPPAILYEPLVDAAGGTGAAAVALAIATVGLAALFFAGARLRLLAAPLLAALAIGLVAETGYVFQRLLGNPGASSRPLTQSNAGLLDWVDRTVGPNAEVTIVPYPVSSAYLVTQQYWRDIEFWNKSVAQHVVYPSVDFFSYTGYWFPKVAPGIEDSDGATALKRTRYALQSVGETRFRFAGTVIQQTQEAMLIDTKNEGRLAWRSFGLYEDGWTRPGTKARVRLYSDPGAGEGVVRYLTLQLRAPDDVASRSFAVSSNRQNRTMDATNTSTAVVGNLLVCVPAHGHADVVVTVDGTSKIPGGQINIADSTVSRQGGILVSGIAVGDETAGAC